MFFLLRILLIILVFILALVGLIFLGFFFWQRIKEDKKYYPSMNMNDLKNRTKTALEKINIDPNVLTTKVLEVTKKEASKRITNLFTKNPKFSFLGDIVSGILSPKPNDKVVRNFSNQLSQEDQDVVNALVNQFNFKKQDCVEALKKLPNDVEITIEEKVRRIVINLAQR